MIAPVKEYIAGLRYGAPVWYYPWKHPGFDLLPLNQSLDPQIISPDNGVVAYVGYSLGAGNICDINLDNGLAVRMCHMKYPASVKTGARINQGDLIGIMGATGTLIIPRGFKHLHYVVFTNHNRNVTTDPAPYLVSNPAPVDLASQVPALFALGWHRLPAAGEILYFQKRLEDKTIVGRDDLVNKITFCYQQQKKLGDTWWQTEKAKYVK